MACAILLGACTLTGTYIRRSAGLSNTLFTFFAYSASAAVLNLLVLLTGGRVTGHSMNNYIAALCLAVFCTFGSHSIFTWSVKYISPTLLAIMKILMPVPTAIILSLSGLCFFYDTACVMKYSALRRTRAGQGQRAQMNCSAVHCRLCPVTIIP